MTRLALAAVLLLAVALRVSLLSGHGFHPDEALYATWARLIATGQDVWLADRVVDKPPLFIYLLAALFGTLGASEAIARLPNLVASLVTIWLTYDIGFRLYRDARVGLLAATTLALSPMAMLFAPTAFVDPTMLCWLMLSAWLLLRGQFGWSGLAFGLGLATKQDAVLFAPLLAIGFVHQPSTFKHQKSFLLGCALPLMLLLGWSTLRPQPDFLRASLEHYGGLALISPADYATRVQSIVRLLQDISSEWLWLLALLAMPVIALRTRHRSDRFLLIAIVYWLMVHLLIGFPLWDRYMLPLAPIAALLIARTISTFLTQWRSQVARSLLIAAVLWLLAQPAHEAINGDIAVGRNAVPHAGMNQVGEFFWRVDTSATVVYVHDLSWELDYYTFGQYLDRRWMPTPAQLAADAAHMSLAQRYVVLTAHESFQHTLADALAQMNLKAAPVFVARDGAGRASVYVYRLAPKAMRGLGYTQLPIATPFAFE